MSITVSRLVYGSQYHSLLDGVDIELTCVDCVFKSNFSIGIDFVVDLGNVSCIVSPEDQCFTLTNATMNFTVLEFEQSANLEVFLGADFEKSFNFT